MAQQARLPDPVYEKAKSVAKEEDITIGAVIDRWCWKADVLDKIQGVCNE